MTRPAAQDGTAADGLDDIEADAAADARWTRVLGPDADRWTLLDDLMTRHHHREPHWYLLAIGIRPDAQNRGLGSQLLIHRHRYLDQAPAYLEATTLDSRRLYQRHGYTDLGELTIPDGPPMWRMLRLPISWPDPQRGPQAT